MFTAHAPRRSAQFGDIGPASGVLGSRTRRIHSSQRAASDSSPALPPMAAVLVVMVCSVAMRCR